MVIEMKDQKIRSLENAVRKFIELLDINTPLTIEKLDIEEEKMQKANEIEASHREQTIEKQTNKQQTFQDNLKKCKNSTEQKILLLGNDIDKFIATLIVQDIDFNIAINDLKLSKIALYRRYLNENTPFDVLENKIAIIDAKIEEKQREKAYRDDEGALAVCQKKLIMINMQLEVNKDLPELILGKQDLENYEIPFWTELLTIDKQAYNELMDSYNFKPIAGGRKPRQTS
jgi:hypothetical protein